MHTGTIWRNFTLAPFTSHHVESVDDIGDGRVGTSSMTFQESFVKYCIKYGNEEWWKWDCMMNIDENMDDLKDYVRTSEILESWNPRILSRHVCTLTMSNFDAYRHSLNKFQCSPNSLVTVQRQWMTLVMGMLVEDVPWYFDRVSINIL